jgi:hypothetical protein
MDGVQPGKIVGRIRCFRGSNVGVAPGASGSRAIRMIRQTIQWGVREVATAKHGSSCSIFRSGLQVALSAEREGFLRPTSLRATTREGIGHGHKPAGQVAGKQRDRRWRKVKKA